jgi:hypothetical protein
MGLPGKDVIRFGDVDFAGTSSVHLVDAGSVGYGVGSLASSATQNARWRRFQTELNISSMITRLQHKITSPLTACATLFAAACGAVVVYTLR